MQGDEDECQRKQRPGGDDRRERRSRSAVQRIEEDRHAERRGAPAQMRRIAVRRLIGPGDDAAAAFAGGEQGDGNPAAEARHRPRRREPEHEIGGRLGNQPVVAQHHDEGGDQARRRHGMGREDHERAQRLVEAARRRTRGEPARPEDRYPRHHADGDRASRSPPARSSDRRWPGRRPSTISGSSGRSVPRRASRRPRRPRSRDRTDWRCGRTGDR